MKITGFYYNGYYNVLKGLPLVEGVIDSQIHIVIFAPNPYQAELIHKEVAEAVELGIFKDYFDILDYYGISHKSGKLNGNGYYTLN